MSLRYVVRPTSIVTTPRRISTELGATSTMKVNARRTHFDANRDLMLAIPERCPLNMPAEKHRNLREFYTRDKRGQRRLLREEGIKTPDDYEAHDNRYVIRPTRHMGGLDYNVQTGDECSSGYYASPLFLKTREYRVIYMRGRRVATYLKKLPEDFTSSDNYSEAPWNHDTAGATFMTINREVNDKLRNTSFYTDTADLLSCQNAIGLDYAGVLAVDVMYRDNDQQYAVCEVNFAPGLSIESTFDTMREYSEYFFNQQIPAVFLAS